MKPTLVTNVHFENKTDLSEFLTSNVLTAIELRSDFISRLKNGEGLVVIINGLPPQALVLSYTIEQQLRGTKKGDILLAIPFA